MKETPKWNLMLSELDLKCLGAIADDYEEIPQISLDLTITAATDVSVQDIALSLHKLVDEKFAKAYKFDELKSEYVEVDFSRENLVLPFSETTWRPMESTNYRLWFYITRTGNDFLEGQTSSFS